MTSSVRTHSIKVLGRDLQVKSPAAPEHVAEVEALVNAKLAEAEAALPGGDTQLATILTLMNLAEMYLAARKENSEQKDALAKRVDALIARMDQQLT